MGVNATGQISMVAGDVLVPFGTNAAGLLASAVDYGVLSSSGAASVAFTESDILIRTTGIAVSTILLWQVGSTVDGAGDLSGTVHNQTIKEFSLVVPDEINLAGVAGLMRMAVSNRIGDTVYRYGQLRHAVAAMDYEVMLSTKR